MGVKLNLSIETRGGRKHIVSIPAVIDDCCDVLNEKGTLLDIARIDASTITFESDPQKGPMSEREYDVNTFYDGMLDAMIDRVAKIDKGDVTFMEEECSELLKEICKVRRGKAPNLITDMTIRGATDDEIARAVRHSMNVIDSVEHNYDWRQSEKDHRIQELRDKYSGVNGGDLNVIEEAIDVLVTCAVYLRAKKVSNSKIKAYMLAKLNRTVMLEGK